MSSLSRGPESITPSAPDGAFRLAGLSRMPSGSRSFCLRDSIRASGIPVRIFHLRRPPTRFPRRLSPAAFIERAKIITNPPRLCPEPRSDAIFEAPRRHPGSFRHPAYGDVIALCRGGISMFIGRRRDGRCERRRFLPSGSRTSPPRQNHACRYFSFSPGFVRPLFRRSDARRSSRKPP